MKARIKNLITTIIGLMLMTFSGYLIFAEYPTTYIYISFGFGLLLIFAKDDLIKKLLNKI